MLNKLHYLLLVSSLTLLAACNDRPPAGTESAPSQSAQSQTTAKPDAPAVLEAGVFVNGTVFEVTPATFRKCDVPSGLVAADIKWDASKAGARFTSVYIAPMAAPDQRKLFRSSKESGSYRTGDWIQDGSILELQNDSNEKVLARVIVKATDC